MVAIDEILRAALNAHASDAPRRMSSTIAAGRTRSTRSRASRSVRASTIWNADSRK
jgi:hypothetical protein